MTANPWSKFFWNDWDTDPNLRLCSMAAQGLWMRLLCIAARSEGKVLINSAPPSPEQIAKLCGEEPGNIAAWLDELGRNGVFSRDRNGVIYSRRMIRDEKKSKIARQNGKLGGSPILGKHNGNSPSVNPQDNPTDNPRSGNTNSHKPEAISHKPESYEEGRERGLGAPGNAIGHETGEPGFSLRAEAQLAPKRDSKPRASPEQWDAFRRAYPDRGTNPNGRSRPMGWPEAEARFHALIRAGEASADDLIAAARAYAESCQGMRDRESVQQAATFLGPRKQTWREFVEAARQPGCGAAISGAKAEDDECWRRRVAYHFEPHPIIVEKHGPRPWDDTWGPPPGEPGCRVPPHILEHFWPTNSAGACARQRPGSATEGPSCLTSRLTP